MHRGSEPSASVSPIIHGPLLGIRRQAAGSAADSVPGVNRVTALPLSPSPVPDLGPAGVTDKWPFPSRSRFWSFTGGSEWLAGPMSDALPKYGPASEK